MRVLFVAGASPATVFGLVPLATAVRAAGHQVFLASTEEMMPVVARTGLAGVPVTDQPLTRYLRHDRAGRAKHFPHGETGPPHRQRAFVGQWFGQLAADSLPSLRGLTAQWRPDLVVGGSLAYAAALISAELGVPYVRLAWDYDDSSLMDAAAEAELAPELARAGRVRLPAPDLRVDVCPPSLTAPGAPPAELMRWTPGNLQCRLAPWMYTRGERRRVCVTAGSRATREQSTDFVRGLVRALDPFDVDIVVPAPDDLAAGLRDLDGRIRADWIPLDVLAPTCDLFVHHAGAATALTAMAAGVPQLVIPEAAVFAPPAQRVADFGAALLLPPDAATPDAVARACGDLLEDPGHRERALTLAREIAAMAPPAELAVALAELASAARASATPHSTAA
ncbi:MULTISPECIES: nucleotide disphospho-sugar-binding domain-containing protein [Streptomyces]